MADESIYEIVGRHEACFQYMKEMKLIMIKGIGYMVVPKSFKLTPDVMLGIAASMEERGIEL